MGVEKSKPETTATSQETASETAKSGLLALKTNVNESVQDGIQNAMETVQDPFENLAETLEALAKKYDNAWDILCALMTPFGWEEEDVETAIHTPTDPPNAPVEATDHISETSQEVVTKPALTTAYRIEEKLHEHPDWDRYISETATRWNIRPSFITTLIYMESSFDPKKKNGESVGFSQAITKAQTEYLHGRYEQFREEIRAKGETPPASTEPDFTDPRTSIDFIGFHMQQKIREANAAVDQLHAPAFYKLSAVPSADKSDKPKWLWLAYNNGGEGYVLLRMYLDQKSEETYAHMRPSQRKKTVYQGKSMESWEARLRHSNSLQEIMTATEALGRGAEEYVKRFDSPPIAKDFIISSPFGAREHPIKHTHKFHNGIDFAVPEGTPVLAILPGTIETNVRNDKTSGNMIILRHDNGTSSAYLHLSQINYKMGTRVAAGQTIGLSGNTGASTGPHLHFIFKDKDGVQHDSEKLVAQAVEARRTYAGKTQKPSNVTES